MKGPQNMKNKTQIVSNHSSKFIAKGLKYVKEISSFQYHSQQPRYEINLRAQGQMNA